VYRSRLLSSERTKGRPGQGLFAVVLAVMAGGIQFARGQDLMQSWVARTAKLDSLHVTGRLEAYRVPQDLDPADPANWRVFGFPSVQFELWLRRPDFRIHFLRTNADGSLFDRAEYAWLDAKLFSHGYPQREGDPHGGSIQADARSGQLGPIPYLTPLEFQLFDWPDLDVPALLAKMPYRAEGNTLTIQMNPAGTWIGRIEVDPLAGFCPRRMSLIIQDAALLAPIVWDLAVLQTTVVAGLPVVSKARIFLSNPNTADGKADGKGRVVYVWEASEIEHIPITRSDLEIAWPAGTRVTDYTTYKEWVVGEPGPPEDVDPALVRAIAESIRAANTTPALQARRQRAMAWIIAAALAVALLIGAMGYQIRRLRHGRPA